MATAEPVATKDRLVVPALAAISTAIAFAAHALGKAPGDAPLPLLAAGCTLALVFGSTARASTAAIGVAALAGFPIEAAIDLSLNGGHNLLPFEFALYGVYLVFGVGAATLGRALARRKRA